MTRGEALAQLVRMRDMKVKRLDEYQGPAEKRHYTRADIAALNYAIDIIEGQRLVELAATGEKS